MIFKFSKEGHFKIDESLVIILGLIFLTVPGYLNFITKGTPLVVWKQVLILLFMAMAMFRARTLFTVSVLYSVLFVMAIWVAYSFTKDMPVSHILFSMFFYITWLPLFVLGNRISLSRSAMKVVSVLPYLILLGGIGCMVQLLTPFLDFIKDDMDSIVLRQLSNSEQRVAFLFVTSTLVMPSLTGLFVIYEYYFNRTGGRLISMVGCGLALIPTGSLAAMISEAFILLMAAIRSNVRQLVVMGALIGVIAVVAGGIALQNTQVQAQIQRITTNDENSESNRFRRALWDEAFDLIGSYDVLQHALGEGVGSTIGIKGTRPSPHLAKHAHGESSYLQSYIEGGWVGTIIRLLPVFLLALGALYKRSFLLLIFAASVFVTCAPAPLMGSTNIQAILGFMAGVAWRGVKPFKLSTNKYELHRRLRKVFNRA